MLFDFNKHADPMIAFAVRMAALISLSLAVEDLGTAGMTRLAWSDEIPAKIRQDWEDRKKKSQKIEIRWKETKTVLEDFRDLTGEETNGEPFVPKPEFRKVGMLFDGNKIRLEESPDAALTPPSPKKRRVTLVESITLFDGDISSAMSSFEERPPQAAEHKKHYFSRELDTGLMHIIRSVRPIGSAYRPGEVPVFEVAEGHLPQITGTCVMLSEYGPGNERDERMVYWVDPVNSNILRAEIHSQSRITARWEMEYGSSNAPWVPKTWTYTSLGDMGRPLLTVVAQLESVTFPSAVAAEKFRLPPLPPGTVFIDERVRKVFEINASGDKVLRTSGPKGKTSPWSLWVSVSVVAIIVLVVVGSFLFRKRGR